MSINYRMAVQAPLNAPIGDCDAVLRTWGLREGAPSHQYLGSSTLPPGRVVAYPNIYQVFGSGATAAVNKIHAGVDSGSWAASQAKNALGSAALQTIFGIQRKLIVENNAPVAELFLNNGYPEYVLSLLFVWRS